MRWSAPTCERLGALQLYRAGQLSEVAKATDQLKAAQEAVNESKNNLDAALAEARAQHPHGIWPEDLTNKIAKHHQDKERRERTLEDCRTVKGRHAKEADRANEEILRIIEDVREGDSLYDQGAKTEEPDAWRKVLVSDVCDEKTAEAASNNGMGTIGQVIAFSKDGTLARLLSERKINKTQVATLSRAVVEYCRARGGIEEQLAEEEAKEATADPEPAGEEKPVDTAPESTDTHKKGESVNQEPTPAEHGNPPPAELVQPTNTEEQADLREEVDRGRKVMSGEAPETVEKDSAPNVVSEGEEPEKEPSVVHVFHDGDRGWAVTDEKGRLYGHAAAKRQAMNLVPKSANKVNDWAPQGYRPPVPAGA
jgi:hypothetical protein